MIKPKSISHYFTDEFGGRYAVSKNAVTRFKKKLKDIGKPGVVFSMPYHKLTKER